MFAYHVILKKYSTYPSRMSCLYVSKTLKKTEDWGKYFAEIVRIIFQDSEKI